MSPTGRPSPTLLKKLRYFRYSSPKGGFGGDWDTLSYSVAFASDAELHRLLVALAIDAPIVSDAGHVDFGVVSIAGVEVTVTVMRAGSAGTISLLAAVYVTDEHVKQAMRVEAELVARGIVMRRRTEAP